MFLNICGCRFIEALSQSMTKPFSSWDISQFWLMEPFRRGVNSFNKLSEVQMPSLERKQCGGEKCGDVRLGRTQCAHISFAHERLWRSQDRAEETSRVNICSCEGLTALKWMISLGWVMQAAERTRLPAERYSLSQLWVLEDEETAASNINTSGRMQPEIPQASTEDTFWEWCWSCRWSSLWCAEWPWRWRWRTSPRREPARPLPAQRGRSASRHPGEPTHPRSTPRSGNLVNMSWVKVSGVFSSTGFEKSALKRAEQADKKHPRLKTSRARSQRFCLPSFCKSVCSMAWSTARFWASMKSTVSDAAPSICLSTHTRRWALNRGQYLEVLTESEGKKTNKCLHAITSTPAEPGAHGDVLQVCLYIYNCCTVSRRKILHTYHWVV